MVLQYQSETLVQKQMFYSIGQHSVEKNSGGIDLATGNVETPLVL